MRQQHTHSSSIPLKTVAGILGGGCDSCTAAASASPWSEFRGSLIAVVLAVQRGIEQVWILRHESLDYCRLPWNLPMQGDSESCWMKEWEEKKVKNCKLININLTPQPNTHKHKPTADQKEEFRMMLQHCMQNLNRQHISFFSEVISLIPD